MQQRDDVPGIDEAALVAALRLAFDERTVLSGDDIPGRNEKDWSSLAPVRPLAVIRPADTQGVALAMRICAAHGVGVVPQGGLTGLCGGAVPSPGSVALSLERLTGVEEIDHASMTMTVCAGTPLERVQQAADAAGFLMPLDLGARGSCAIGGNVSTNAGGNRVIRYGMARDLVLGLEVVLADGSIVSSLNKMIKNNAGYDLKQLFIGSEGTLGIITRIVLRLYPKPACVSAALCALDSYGQVLRLLADARRGLGSQLSAFELMWSQYWDVVTTRIPGVRNPFSSRHGFYVLIEAHGIDEAVDGDRFERWLERQIEREVIADAAVARSIGDVRAFWNVRDAVSEFVQAIGPHEAFDIGLPVSDMDRYAQSCLAEMTERLPGAVALFYGHVGDGNLHVVACQPGTTPQPKEVIQTVIYETVRRFEGTISAEHGIGTTKKRWLAYTRNQAELDLMRRLKQVLDPQNVLNPTKVI